jgi:hypothetical protein
MSTKMLGRNLVAHACPIIVESGIHANPEGNIPHSGQIGLHTVTICATRTGLGSVTRDQKAGGLCLYTENAKDG